uniref:Eukaryotic translation initiation factor 1B n=1 Tax=Ficedula albicollis TaxID=59894 RepID=U3KCT0_FICAL
HPVSGLVSSAQEIISSVTVSYTPCLRLSNVRKRCTSPCKCYCFCKVSYADGRSFLSYQQGSLTLPGQRSPPALSVSSRNPFADATKGDDLLPAGTEDYIHIRIQQRNGRKTLTTVQGIADDYDKKKLVKAFKKKFACNGTVIEHPEYGEVIQLQGDQRKNICQFLLEIGIVKEEQLKVHGF